MKSKLIKPYAYYIARQIRKERNTALRDQERIFAALVEQGCRTAFGKDHDFSNIRSHQDYIDRIEVNDYEGLRTYFDRLVKGEKDVLWPGLPKYFAKTSGTTSGIKYIPITRESMPNHIGTARKALMGYASHPGKSKLFDGKVMFLSGSPTFVGNKWNSYWSLVRNSKS